MFFISSKMGLMSWIGKLGSFASRFAGRSGFIGSLASGVSKASNLITKYAPKVMNIGKTVLNVARTGLGLMQKTGILNKIDKHGNFTKVASKVGLINNTSNQSDVAQQSGGGN